LQANPNKTKQKSLDLLGFIWPIRDLSVGYAAKNKKNPGSRLRLCAERLKQADLSQTSFPFVLGPPGCSQGSATDNRNYLALFSDFCKSICELALARRFLSSPRQLHLPDNDYSDGAPSTPHGPIFGRRSPLQGQFYASDEEVSSVERLTRADRARKQRIG
jgi:hypothetical protein